MSTITGRTAITVAEMLGVSLHKHADPTEGAREGLTTEEARAVCRIDPSLIWVDSEEVAYAIDDRRISVLRSEAETAGDYRQLALCDIALGGAGAQWVEGRPGEGGAPTTRMEARVACALALAAARAQS